METNNKKRIFLDYAASTPVSERAKNAYIETLKVFANPQALHKEGLEAANIRDDARKLIAKNMEVKSQELIFTSGGTESNNIAIAGYLLELEKKGLIIGECHVIISAIEHPSVTEVLIPFISKGLSVSRISPNEHGETKEEEIEKEIKKNTVLVSIALVNSEIGVVQPIHSISKKIKEYNEKNRSLKNKFGKVVFHTDAGQGAYQKLTPKGMGVDLMSLDSGKMYGPRGVGVLYIENSLKLSPVLRGGSQEEGLRPGTENISLYMGFAIAFEEVAELRNSERERLEDIRKTLLKSLKEKLPTIVINGDSKSHTPHILNVSIPNIDSEYVAMYLDQRGVALSTKSACLTRENSNESFVVKALGGEKWRSRNTIRFSFGRDTEIKDVITIVEKVKEAVDIYKSFKN